MATLLRKRASRPMTETLHPPGGGGDSGRGEQYAADERLRRGSRVVGIDRDRHRPGIFIVVVDPLEVLANVSALGEPLSEPVTSGADDHVADGAVLLAGDHGPHRGRGVPDVPDDPGTDLLREAWPDHIHLGGFVVQFLPAGVRAFGQHDHLPRPFENRRLLEVDPPLDVLGNGRAVAATLEPERPAAVDVHDGEVVGGATPALTLPALGDAAGLHRHTGPVLDDYRNSPTRRGDREQE